MHLETPIGDLTRKGMQAAIDANAQQGRFVMANRLKSAISAFKRWGEVSDQSSERHIPDDHPLRQYMDADLLSCDHVKFFEIFKKSLRADVSDLLFEKPLSVNRLKVEDLKKCEERRLNSFPKKHNDEIGETEVCKCIVFDRLYVASAFADSLVRTFDGYKDIRHPRDEIEALENLR